MIRNNIFDYTRPKIKAPMINVNIKKVVSFSVSSYPDRQFLTYSFTTHGTTHTVKYI